MKRKRDKEENSDEPNVQKRKFENEKKIDSKIEFNLGLECEKNEGKYEKAIEHYTKFIELDTKPENISLGFHRRGICHEKLGKLELALFDCDSALDIEKSERNYHRKVLLYIDNAEKFPKGSSGKYLCECNNWICLFPNSSMAYFVRGGLYMCQSKYHLAFKDFGKSIEIDPKNPEFYFLRGFAKNYLHDYVSALNDFNKYLLLQTLYYQTEIPRKEIYFSRGKANEFGPKNYVLAI